MYFTLPQSQLAQWRPLNKGLHGNTRLAWYLLSFWFRRGCMLFLEEKGMLFSFLRAPVHRVALLALVAATIIVAVSVPAALRRPAATAHAAASALSSQPNFAS